MKANNLKKREMNLTINNRRVRLGGDSFSVSGSFDCRTKKFDFDLHAHIGSAECNTEDLPGIMEASSAQYMRDWETTINGLSRFSDAVRENCEATLQSMEKVTPQIQGMMKSWIGFVFETKLEIIQRKLRLAYETAKSTISNLKWDTTVRLQNIFQGARQRKEEEKILNAESLEELNEDHYDLD